MSLGIFLAVLGSAFLHALWNALIKLGTSKVGGMVILSIVEVPIGLMVVLFTDAIDRAAVPWVIAAGCTHFAYKFFLTYAYDRGDLSRVYPIARGAAPMVVALVGAVFLADAVTGQEYLAIAVLAAGILLMARGVFASGEDRRLLPFALGSACATATYTLIDGMGSRISGGLGLCRGRDVLYLGNGCPARLGRDPAQFSCLADGGCGLGCQLRGLWRVDLGDVLCPDCGRGGAARNFDPVCRADRLADLWRKDDRRKGDCVGGDRGRGDPDAALTRQIS